METVKRIALADQEKRGDSLLDILREEKLPFAHFRERHRENWVENTVVSVNPSSNRLVFGAHYDSVEGSAGANDNAAGVSVLLHFAKSLLTRPGQSADIVFFDREEYENRGSERYILTTGKNNIAAMVNLDACGYGDGIAVYAKGNGNNARFLAKTARRPRGLSAVGRRRVL